MKRIIVDYSKLNDKILDLLVKKYPNGYSTMDIITFHDKNKNPINALQVEDEDAIYLVKVSTRLSDSMEEHKLTEDIIDDEILPDTDIFPDDDDFDDLGLS